MINRLFKPLKSNSFFLFGPRGTGKTTWLKSHFPQNTLWIDLLNPYEEERFALQPLLLSELIDKHKPAWVVIDEVQKNPKLLNIVHSEIEKRSSLFALTGSSARKLKRGAANLLAGRAFVYYLHPFTHLEFGNSFDISETLTWGSLPKLTEYNLEAEKKTYLKSYAQTYLKEEIISEQIIRKLDPFRRFLAVAAQQNGEVINYTSIAKDVGTDVKTVQSYFQILEDTLVGFMLPAYHHSIRKQQTSNPKFYFFDIGIKRALEGSLGNQLVPHTYGYGKIFEHFVILEMLRLNDYFEKDFRFYYLRTKDHAEIDLIIERPGQATALVEIKSATQIDERHVRTLNHFQKSFKNAQSYCLSQDKLAHKIGEVEVLHWQEGLKELGFTPPL